MQKHRLVRERVGVKCKVSGVCNCCVVHSYRLHSTLAYVATMLTITLLLRNYCMTYTKRVGVYISRLQNNNKHCVVHCYKEVNKKY